MRYFLLAMLTIIALSLQAQTTHYITQTGAGTKDGSSWTNAGDSSMVQTFIDAAAAGDNIWIAQGTYIPNTYPPNCIGCSSNRDHTFYLKSGVKIYGGFVGTEQTLADRTSLPILTSGVSTNTIFSGEINNTSNSTDNVNHVVTAFNVDANTELNGIKIRGGYANSDSMRIVLVNGDSVSYYGGYGGGMTCYQSHAKINHCSFENNTAFNGGGIYGTTNFQIIHSSAFMSNNTLHGIYWEGGGGIYSDVNGQESIGQCVFFNNSSGGIGGGGAAIIRSNTSIGNTIFESNSATNNSVGTLSLIAIQQTINIANCIFSSNAGYTDAADIDVWANTTANITNCTFTNWLHLGSSCVPSIFVEDNSTVKVLYSIFGNSSCVPIGYESPSDYATLCSNYSTLNLQFLNVNAVAGADNTYFTTDDGLQAQASCAGVSSLYDYCSSSYSPITTDILGNARPQTDSTFAIGAYELRYLVPTPPIIDSVYTSTTNNSDTICYNTTWSLIVGVAYHNASTATTYWSKNNGAWTQGTAVFTPTTLHAGDSVQYKIVSTDPCHTGTVYSNWIHMPAPPVVLYDTTDVHISYAPPICSGHPVTLTAVARNANNPTFIWSRYTHGQVGTGASYTINSPVNGDTYDVRMTATGVCTTQTVFSASLNLYVQPSQPPVTITYNSTYNELHTSEGNVDWYRDGVLAGHTQSYNYVYTPTQSGCYYAIYDPNDACPSVPSNQICVNFCTGLNAGFTYSPSNLVCTGKTVIFTSTSTGATSYTWKWQDYNTGEWITIGHTASITDTFGGAVNNFIRLIVSNGSCLDSVQHTITVYQSPPTPTLELNSGVLEPLGLYGLITWYLNGAQVTEDIGVYPDYPGVFHPQQTGDYYAVVANINGNGCTEQSNTIHYMGPPTDTTTTPTGIKDTEQDNFSIIPNPTFSIVTISGLKQNTPIIVTNMLGEVLIKDIVDADKKVMDVSNLASGVYFVNRKKLVKL